MHRREHREATDPQPAKPLDGGGRNVVSVPLPCHSVGEYANAVRVRHGIPFGVRIGLNSGDVVVGRIGVDLLMDYSAQGLTVGLVLRMEVLAESGHICISEHTARLVEGFFQLQELGRTRVKRVGEPVGLFDLEGVGSFRTRFDRVRARGLSRFAVVSIARSRDEHEGERTEDDRVRPIRPSPSPTLSKRCAHFRARFTRTDRSMCSRPPRESQ